ncbi:type IV toxin-antitoxin system AbiEi family antitoxin domain-containing protein [Microlunatus sp. Y2014]|uniref:type IV toxin-antitoxin system AbiEi family antitoxin domain-containing protein n=1 Tax=Microlunatus sp. Y2014 TaxID=3418488 RepID=UPI003DA7185F
MAGATLARLGSIADRRWGLFTTAQAEASGVSRKQLSRMASTGALERVTQGVYRMAGAPHHEHEPIYATWLALGGATALPTQAGVAAVVAAGTTAAALHDIGDFIPSRFDFIVPSRKATRLPGVRLRIRTLARDDVIPTNGLPTLTIERTIADLVELGTDISLVADAVRDAVRADKLIAPQRLAFHLAPIAKRRKTEGTTLLNDLFQLADAHPEGWVLG